MKISGQHKGKFSILWVKGKSPNIFLDYLIYQIKNRNQVQADRIPAGPSLELTLVPWKTMQEGLPNTPQGRRWILDHYSCANEVIYYS